MEFRQNMRKLVENPDVAEADALFNSLDLDKSGLLDVNEVKIALKKLQREAGSAAADKSSALTSAESLRTRATLAAEAARKHGHTD